MPLYDYFCNDCAGEFEEFNCIEERDKALCPYCQSYSTQLLITCNKRDFFRAHWNEHLDHNPIYVESKEHYKKLCKEKGVTARCLM